MDRARAVVPHHAIMASALIESEGAPPGRASRSSWYCHARWVRAVHFHYGGTAWPRVPESSTGLCEFAHGARPVRHAVLFALGELLCLRRGAAGLRDSRDASIIRRAASGDAVAEGRGAHLMTGVRSVLP